MTSGYKYFVIISKEDLDEIKSKEPSNTAFNKIVLHESLYDKLIDSFSKNVSKNTKEKFYMKNMDKLDFVIPVYKKKVEFTIVPINKIEKFVKGKKFKKLFLLINLRSDSKLKEIITKIKEY